MVYQATICHIKGYIHTFHMRHISIIWYIRLQSYQSHTPLSLIGLVGIYESNATRKHLNKRTATYFLTKMLPKFCQAGFWALDVADDGWRNFLRSNKVHSSALHWVQPTQWKGRPCRECNEFNRRPDFAGEQIWSLQTDWEEMEFWGWCASCAAVNSFVGYKWREM